MPFAFMTSMDRVATIILSLIPLTKIDFRRRAPCPGTTLLQVGKLRFLDRSPDTHIAIGMPARKIALLRGPLGCPGINQIQPPLVFDEIGENRLLRAPFRIEQAVKYARQPGAFGPHLCRLDPDLTGPQNVNFCHEHAF